MKRVSKLWGLIFYGVELYAVFNHEEDAQEEADKKNKKVGRELWEALPVNVTWEDGTK